MRTLFIIFVTIGLLALAGFALYQLSEVENKNYDLTTCAVLRWKQSLNVNHNYYYTEPLTEEQCEQLKKELLK